MHPRRKPQKRTQFLTRTDLEWAMVLDLYKIRWQYLPAPVELSSFGDNPLYQFEFFLPGIKTYVDTKGDCAARAPLICSRGVHFGGTHVVLGSSDGSFQFHPVPHYQPRTLLQYCPDCRKYFFSPRDEYFCGFCGDATTWIQEELRLPWFGFTGKVKIHPRNIRTVNKIEPDEDQQSSLNESDGVDAQSALSPPLFKEADAKVAKAREDGDWEKLRGQLSGIPRVHQWPSIDRLEALAERYPNFKEVCLFVQNELRLSRLKPDKSVQLPNILLVGSPSCGKSSFATLLAEILVDQDHTRIDMGQQATNFALVGTDSGFKKGKEGRILRAMAGHDGERPVRNPLIIFDEMDKVISGGQWDPLPALLSVLEKRDARRFVDEFFVVPVDASGLNFLALANDARTVPGPLASRFVSFTIPD